MGNTVVVRVRPQPAGVLRASFGFTCAGADVTLTVDLKFDSPPHVGGAVTITCRATDREIALFVEAQSDHFAVNTTSS